MRRRKDPLAKVPMRMQLNTLDTDGDESSSVGALCRSPVSEEEEEWERWCWSPRIARVAHEIVEDSALLWVPRQKTTETLLAKEDSCRIGWMNSQMLNTGTWVSAYRRSCRCPSCATAEEDGTEEIAWVPRVNKSQLASRQRR